jgi:hypothetical protein
MKKFITTLALCATPLAVHAGNADPASAGLGFLTLGIILACYFLPSIIAMVRGKATGTGGVVFVNFFLGWTVVGWFLAFVWACTGLTNADKAREQRRHEEMMAAVSGRIPPRARS